MDEEELNRALGDAIKKRRIELGLTQQGLADLVPGLSQGKISEIENGSGAGPHVRRGIAIALGKPLYELYGSSEPIKLRQYQSVAQRLLQLGVPRHGFYERAHFFEDNSDRRCVDTTACIMPLRGQEGLEPNLIAVDEIPVTPSMHQCVETQLEQLGDIGEDRTKVALTAWSQSPIDADGGKLKLRVSPMKYSVKLAMRAAGHELLQGVVDRDVTILGGGTDARGWPARLLPCHLHCDGLVLTGDSHILLSQRSDECEIEKQRWGASFGEGMEWAEDRGTDGRLHPLHTIYRGLEQELGIDREWIEEHVKHHLKISFLDLGFQLDNLVYVLFSLIELPTITIEEALDHARSRRKDGGEIREIVSMDFCPEQCASAIVSGYVEGRRLINAARFAILIAAQNKFPVQIAAKLERYVREGPPASSDALE